MQGSPCSSTPVASTANTRRTPRGLNVQFQTFNDKLNTLRQLGLNLLAAVAQIPQHLGTVDSGVFHALALTAGEVWTAKNVPIPFLRDSTQYVSDPDGYVDKAQKDSANFYLQKLKLECGVQNVLIIVGKVDNQDAFRMAQDVGNQYGIGYKKSRRGLVIVIAVEDHKYFIAPGSGLEGELTDVDCDDIARACIVKYMREGNPGEAVASVSRAIYNKVKSGRTGIADVDEGSVNDEEDWFLVISCFLSSSVFLSICLSGIFWRCSAL